MRTGIMQKEKTAHKKDKKRHEEDSGQARSRNLVFQMKLLPFRFTLTFKLYKAKYKIRRLLRKSQQPSIFA